MPLSRKVVEAELGIGAVGDVAAVVVAALVGWLGVLDTADGKAEVAVERTHPLGVPFGEVVVDGDDVHAHAGEGIEVDGEGGDESFTFTGLHLGDDAAMESGAADELDVEVDHFPEDFLVGDVDGLPHMRRAPFLTTAKASGRISSRYFSRSLGNWSSMLRKASLASSMEAGWR